MVPSRPPNPGSRGGPRPFGSLAPSRHAGANGYGSGGYLGSMGNANLSSLLTNHQLDNAVDADQMLFGSDDMNGLAPQFALTHQNQLRQGPDIASLGNASHLEPQMGMKFEQHGHPLGSVRALGPAKLDRQNSDNLMLSQQQQQHLMPHLTSQPSQGNAGPMNNFEQQRLMQHLQQLNAAKSHLQQNPLAQQQPVLQQPGAAGRPQGKPTYEPGTCARRLAYYMNCQRERKDNSIDFWRTFVGKFFTPNAKKRWCVSLYNHGRQTAGVFPQDMWHCEICKRSPGRGFETTAEVLPRLFQIKYDSGTLEELLYVDMPREFQNASGQIVLDYTKAVQESVFAHLRVVREGHLRIVFSPELKICSWEFCARRHDELIPKRLLIPQVCQLATVVQKYQNLPEGASSMPSVQELQSTCNSFLACARQLGKSMEVPLVNDLGYSKRYVRCLQISEVVNSMKALIDFSTSTGTGPKDSLINFPRASSKQALGQPEDQGKMMRSSSQNDQTPVLPSGVQFASMNEDGASASSSANNVPTSCNTTLTGLVQNPLSSRPENQSPTLSTSNNNAAATSNAMQMNSAGSPATMPPLLQPTSQAFENDPTEPPTSVPQVLQQVMPQPSGMGSNMRGTNGIIRAPNGTVPAINGLSTSFGRSSYLGTGVGNNCLIGGMGYGGAGINGLRSAAMNNAMNMNGRVMVNHVPQHHPSSMSQYLMQQAQQQQWQQSAESRFLSGLGQANGFDLPFDWKPSP